MPSPQPLEFPEILLQVALWVSARDRPACARVSKAWYQVFVPLIWKSILWNMDRHGPPEAARRHADLVKSLSIGIVTEERPVPRFPNLKSLFLGYNPQHPRLILDQPSIAALRFHCLQPAPEPTLWDGLLGFHHLKALWMDNSRIHEKNTDSFWQLCTRLEKLHLAHHIVGDNGRLPSMEFPHVKELDISSLSTGEYGSIPLSVDFMQRCPSLTLCCWTASEDEVGHIPRFTQLVAEKTWPELRSVSIRFCDISVDDLSNIVRGMQHDISLNLSYSPNTFTPSRMDLLRSRFSYLKVLELAWSDRSVTCPMVQEVLSSCPSLQYLSATRIDAALVAEGKPWVCLGLQVLDLDFSFNPSTTHIIQPLLFDQLARLTRLQELYLRRKPVYGWKEDASASPFHEAIDLRLENGLYKLSTLRSLRVIDYGHSKQRMEDQEIDWILEHWRRLKLISGKLNAQKPETDRRLVEKLKGHGIETLAVDGVTKYQRWRTGFWQSWEQWVE
ncbi:MAG: hypothetical protein J3Q66DRAFT_64169 [Benniella sp.]|nr:MAG: hypothetical protein J3Q66DRAFT_64169 [Benniella sp.]